MAPAALSGAAPTDALSVLHESNLIHLLLVAAVGWFVERYARRSAHARLGTVSRLIQILCVLFAADLMIGLTLIDSVFGASPSAGWVSKAIVFFALLLVFAIWRGVHHGGNRD